MVIGEIQHISPMELLKMAANPPFPWEDDVYLKPIVEDDPLLQFGMYCVCLYCLYNFVFVFFRLFVGLSVFICLCVYACMHAYVCVCTPACTCVLVCLSACVFVYVHACICAWHGYTCMCVFCVNLFVFSLFIHGPSVIYISCVFHGFQ